MANIKLKDLLKEDDIVKNKKTGNVYVVKQMDPSKHDRPTPAEVDKANQSNGGQLPKGEQPSKPTQQQKPQGQKLGGNDFKSSAETPDRSTSNGNKRPGTDDMNLKNLMPGIKDKIKNWFSGNNSKSSTNTSKQYKLKTGETITTKVINKQVYPNYVALDIASFDENGKKIGSAHFNSDETNSDKEVTSTDTMVKPDWRRKGVASNMYDFATNLGYKVVPSKTQTPDGKQFSNSLTKK